jgi:hypothetical protein
MINIYYATSIKGCNTKRGAMSVQDKLRAGSYQPNPSWYREPNIELSEDPPLKNVNIPEARIMREFNLDDMANIPSTNENVVDAWNDYINALTRANVGIAHVRPVDVF